MTQRTKRYVTVPHAASVSLSDRSQKPVSLDAEPWGHEWDAVRAETAPRGMPIREGAVKRPGVNVKAHLAAIREVHAEYMA
jgi:hypothetical protein